MDVEDERKQHFGIFAITNDIASPLSNKAFMGDIIARATRRGEKVSFCYKRKIVVKKDETDSEDEMFLRLMFLQVVDDYIEGLHRVDSFEENCDFAAKAIYVDCEGEVPEDTESLIDDAAMMEYIPKHIREKYDEVEWAEKILPILQNMDDDADDVQNEFLQWGKEQKWFGSMRFEV